MEAIKQLLLVMLRFLLDEGIVTFFIRICVFNQLSLFFLLLT